VTVLPLKSKRFCPTAASERVCPVAACAAAGLAYHTENCVASGHVGSTADCAASGSTCPTAASAASGCFYFAAECAVSERIYPTAACDASGRLFHGCRVCSTAACAFPDVSLYCSLCCPWKSLPRRCRALGSC
jgi:hypothetical protein